MIKKTNDGTADGSEVISPAIIGDKVSLMKTAILVLWSVLDEK